MMSQNSQLRYRWHLAFLLLLLSMLTACGNHQRISVTTNPSFVMGRTEDGTPFVLQDGVPNAAYLFDEDYRMKYILEMDAAIAESIGKFENMYTRWYDAYLLADFEQDYGNITVTLDKTVVVPDFGKLTITVKNPAQNPYFVWDIPFLEHYVNGSWERIASSHLQGTYYWHVVGSENWYWSPKEQASYNQELSYSTTLSLERISAYPTEKPYFPELIPGEYRIAVYVGKEILYAPFTVTEE